MDNLIVYQFLYVVLLYLTLASLVGWLTKRTPSSSSPAWYLRLGLVLALLTAICLPLTSRFFSDSSPMLAWECETVIEHFDAYQRNQSTLEFARASLRRNPGLLSTSGNSLLFGIPTFAVLKTIGWNTFSLRLVSYIMGLASLIIGFVIIRVLFNSSVALIFTAIFATNPLFIYYMGYGVSQTATVCGFFAGLALTLCALKGTPRTSIIWAGLAGLALLMATYNYGPGRIFVIATLVFLALYGSSAIRSPDSTRTSRIAALTIIAITVGLFLIGKKINPSSDFTTVRGEQAFAMLNHQDEVARYLGKSQEIQSLPPGPLPLRVKLEFLLTVVSDRVREFLTRYSPMHGLRTYYERGSQHGEAFRPYQSALIIPMLIGFFAGIRTWRARSSLLLLCLFFVGLVPLFLTNRVDNHRSFLLLLPLTTWAAHGVWILLQRLRGGWVAELHAGAIWCAATIAMALNAWFFLGVSSPVDSGVERLLAHSSTHIKSGASIIPSMFNCQTHAMLALKIAEAKRLAHDSPPVLWPTEFGQQLTDERFRDNLDGLSEILENATVAPVVVISARPLNRFTEWTRQSHLQVSEDQGQPFHFTVLTKR